MLAIFGSYFVYQASTVPWHWEGSIDSESLPPGWQCHIQVHRFAAILKTKPNKPCLINKCNNGGHWPACWAVKRQWERCVGTIWRLAVWFVWGCGWKHLPGGPSDWDKWRSCVIPGRSYMFTKFPSRAASNWEPNPLKFEVEKSRLDGFLGTEALI